MADDKKKSGGGGGTAVVIFLAICVAASMASGGRRVVRSQASTSGSMGQPAIVTVENASTFDGVLRVSTSACEQVDATQLRYDAVDSVGSRIGSITRDYLSSQKRQTVTIGRGLPEGRYTVKVTCLAQGQPVGDFRTVTFKVKPTRSSGRVANTMPLPHTGA